MKAHIAAEASAPAVLLVGFPPADRDAFGRLIGPGVELVAAGDETEALSRLEEGEVALLCLGAGVPAERAKSFLEEVVSRRPDSATVRLVLAGGPDPGIFLDLVSEDHIYYLTQQPVIDADLAAIVGSALDRWRSRRRGEEGPEAQEKEARRLQTIVEAARRVALQRSLASAGELTELAAVRRGGRPPFSGADLETLETLADQVASSFSQLVLQGRLDALAWGRERQLRDGGEDLFRREAVEHYAAGAGEHGDVLRLSPRWSGWTYRLLLALVVAALAFSLIGRLREWASGPAVVRMQGSRELTATASGVVTSIEVKAGQKVEAGALLVRFYAAQELAELQRIQEEFELQLANRLRNPSDRGAAAALLALRAQRQLAEARLSERSVRAPFAGEVSDLRVRQGQLVGPGESWRRWSRSGPSPRSWCCFPATTGPWSSPGCRCASRSQATSTPTSISPSAASAPT